jgi:hypothetical protein
MAALMFMSDRLSFDDPDLRAASTASYQVLAQACAPFEPGGAGTKGTEALVWSLVQGYASLESTGNIDPDETPFTSILPLLFRAGSLALRP